jgi:Tol biopolymer transport system component
MTRTCARSPAMHPPLNHEGSQDRRGYGRLMAIGVVALVMGNPSPRIVQVGAAEARHQRITYSVIEGSSLHIGTMNEDGSGRRIVTRGPALDQGPAWRPTGSSILFASDRGPGFQLDLWTVDPRTGSLRRLAQTRKIDEVEPAWSPNGRRIAFIGVPLGAGGGLSTPLHVMAGDGSRRRQLTQGHQDGSPVWSPDGRVILFSRIVHKHSQLFTIRPNGTHLRQRTFANHGGAAPDWSPDGTRIIFQSGDLPADIFVKRLGKGRVRRITQGPAHDEVPDWSPCGDRIAFQSDRSGETGTWRMRPDGSGVRLVNRRALSPEWKPGCVRWIDAG